ncbi:MAG: thiopurine S-methyltransferase [Pseudoalteromonas sp.]
MDANHWHERWEKNEIGFHEDEVNQYLDRYFTKLNLQQGDTVFVPLCGKTFDIHFLLKSGIKVIGAELSEIAISQLFSELQLSPTITEHGELKCYSANNLIVWVGNIFDVSKELLGPIGAVYDRAALVALPSLMRERYSQHVIHLSQNAPQLLLVFQYQQREMAGPPFSIETSEIHKHYAAYYQLNLLCEEPVEGGLKGQVSANNVIWHLS